LPNTISLYGGTTVYLSIHHCDFKLELLAALLH
jgi:hypothetical protein